MAYGQDGHIGISFQDSYGTSEVGSLEYFPFISEGMVENIENLMSESLASRYEEPDAYEGMHAIEGEIAMEVHPNLVGKLCKAWAGQSSQDTLVGSCYSHIMPPLNSDWDEEKSALPPCTIEVYRDTGSAYQYYDMLLNSLTFEIAQGALYKCTAGWIGANFEWVNQTTPAFEAGSYYSWDVVSVSLGGGGIDDVNNLTVTLTNNLAGKAYLDGTKNYGRILRDGFRTIEVAGTMLLNGDAQAKIYRARTQQRLIISAWDPTTIALGHNEFKIDVPKMRYTEFPANIGGVGLVEVGFSAKGDYDTTSEYAVQFTVVNTTLAY